MVIKYNLNSHIPKHLRGIQDLEEMKKADLKQLEYELRNEGGVERKIEEGKIFRLNIPGMVMGIESLKFVTGENIKEPKDINEYNIEVFPMHPHRADLAITSGIEAGQNLDVSTLTTNCILKDKYGKYMTGVRGSETYMGGSISIPGGHPEFSFDWESNLFEHLKKIIKSRVGIDITEDEIEDNRRPFENADTRGTNVMYEIKSKLTSDEIMEKWRKCQEREHHKEWIVDGGDIIKKMGENRRVTLDNKVEYGVSQFFHDCARQHLGIVDDYLNNEKVN